MKKILIILMIFGFLIINIPQAQAVTLSDLQKEIEILKQEIFSLKTQLAGQVLGVTATSFSMGMRDSRIIPFQQKLIEQKFLAEGNATGVFGLLTYTAVKNFQTSKGLKADGVLGPLTQTKIMDGVVLVGDPEPLCAPNSWSKKANFGGIGRQGPFGFSVGSKGYIGGGSNQGTILSDFWEWNQATNTWTQKADFGGGKRAEATGFSIGTKGYVGTGYWLTSTNNIKDTKDFWEYDPSTNVWTRKSDFGGAERSNATSFGINNKGYIGTGDFKKDFWEYDPLLDNWTQKADFGGERRDGAIGFALGGKGYIGTGDLSPANNTVLKDFWEYDPSTNVWTQKADFGGSAGTNGAGFSLNNKGYAQVKGDFYEYDSTLNKWAKKANFPLPYLNTEVGFSVGKYGYIGGGNNAGTLTKDFWQYCPGASN